jgi:uncharacterized membrane protein
MNWQLINSNSGNGFQELVGNPVEVLCLIYSNNQQLMQPASINRSRIASIDLLRGIVMVVMALDHVRDFFHNDANLHNPLDPKTTTAMLFFTRFITHFCAPVFIMLAGTSAYLMAMHKSKKSVGEFLIKRGFWLIFVEVGIVTLAITFDPLYHALILQVIWAIGISMILLGILIRLRLSYSALLTIGCLIILSHNLLDYPEAARGQHVGFWWNLLHHGFFTFYPYVGGHGILIVYAFLPWTGIMILGYCLGKLFEPDYNASLRRRNLLTIGFGMLALFFVLRLMNGYGDPVPWSIQRNTEATLLSFLNINKYPPSLMYVSITLGPALIFLAVAEGMKNRITAFFTIFGRVPLFYYVLHFFLIHLLTVIAFFLSGNGLSEFIDPASPLLFRPKLFGFDLWVVYLVWALVISIMYPLCKKYDNYKSTHRKWWLSYV